MAYKVIALQPQHLADWERLYSSYADFCQVEQTAEMRSRVWNWIMEGKIIGLVALDASERGVGLVDTLFGAAQEVGRQRGWSIIRWITREDNYRARAVYDRLAQKTNWVTYDLVP